MKKTVLIGVFLVLFGIIVISQVENKKNDTIKSNMLSSPIATLDALDVIYDDFLKETTQNSVFRNDYKEVIRKFEQKSPIFLLGECSYKYCFLTRKNHPEFRENFENHTCVLLQQKIEEKKGGSIYCISFGSGGLFQDLIIFSKTLSQYPEANLIIHLIDRVFNKTDENLKEFITQKEADKRDWIRPNIQLLIEDEKFETVKIKAKISQFKNFLTTEFPHANITIYTHKNIDDYFDYIEKEKMSHADVTFAADVSGGLDDYEKLCIKTMQLNSSSVNVLLLHNDKQAWLHQFFLENAENRVKTAVKDNENIDIYYERVYIDDTKKT